MLDSLIQSIGSYINTQKTIKAQKQLARYQYQKDLEMWNMSNEYNKPQNQMNRLKEAGLNPNLVYGTGTVTGNTVSPTMPRYQQTAPEYNYTMPRISETLDVLNRYQDYKFRKANVEGVALDNEDKRARNFFTWENHLYDKIMKESDSGWRDITNKYKYAEIQKKVDEVIPKELARQSAQIGLLGEQKRALEFENYLGRFGINRSDSAIFRILLQATNPKGFPKFGDSNIYKQWFK